MKKITFIRFLALFVLLFSTTISFSQVVLPTEPACSFSGCNAGDLTITKAYIAQDNDVPLPACAVGDPINAFLYLQVNTGPKYNIYVQFDLYINNVKINGSDKYTYAEPVTGTLIPNTPIKIAPISFTCGDVIELKNIYVSWKTGGAKNNDASCAGIGGAGSKCADASAVPDIVVNTPISPNFTVNKSCDGDDFEKVVFTNTSTGGDGTLTYLWDFDGGVSNQPLTNEGPHTVTFASGGSKNITLTVTDSDNDVAVKNIGITINSCCVDPEITNPGPVTACDSYTLPVISGSNLTGNEAYYDDSQANGGIEITNLILTSSQTVWIYDADGSCSDEESFLVTIEDSVKADILEDVTECDSYALQPLTNGSYYTGSGGTGDAKNAGDLIETTTMLYVYVAATDTCPSDESSFTVTIEDTPEIEVSSTNVTCFGAANGTIIVSGLEDGETYIIQLNGEGNDLSEQTTFGPGTYLITASSNGNNQEELICSTSEEVVITQPSQIFVNAGTNKLLTCNNPTATLIGNASTNDQISLTYLWTTTSGVIDSGANTLTPVVSAPGIYTLTVSTIDGEIVCSASDTVQVTQDATKPTAVLTAETTELNCNITSIVLDASESIGGDKFLWKGGATTSSITVTEPGTYYVIVIKNSNGCVATKTITITQNSIEPEVVISGDSELTCETTSVTLDASNSTVQGTANYLWSTGETTATIVVTEPNDYTVTVTDSDNGCSTTSEVFTVTEDLTVEIIDKIDDAITLCIEDVDLDLTTLLVEDFTPGGTWTDDLNSGGLSGDFFDPSIVNLGAYQFTYTEPGDCGRIIKVYVLVNDDCVVLPCSTTDLEVSKVVTPNNDGFNDQFELLGLEGCGFTFDVQIFNRWGKMVYQSNNYQNNWRGNFNTGGATIGSSTKLPTGTYYYIVNVLSSGFEPITGYIYLGTH